VVLQVLRHDDLARQAESNRTAVVPIVPNRGQILDRNGVVLATNYSAYTLEITPSRLDRPGRDHRRGQVIEIRRATAAASSACGGFARASSRCRSACA
jgi:cell division protein FtsI/penicillin-binding protein 2